MSLKNVSQIDYGTISILTAISDETSLKKVMLKGNMPDNIYCRNLMIDAGYLNRLYDQKGNSFPKSPESELIFFEKGSVKLLEADIKKISATVKNVVEHLTGSRNQCLPVKTILLEICGNSIEWSGTENKYWLLGVKYEKNLVTFTVVDIGKGILNNLHRKFKLRLSDTFRSKTDHEILIGAFEKKYGSTTKEVNRNKGLPAVKNSFEMDTIQNLKVITNNVILHFDKLKKSKTFKPGTPRLKGTFFQWEMTKESMNEIKTN